MIGKVLNSAGMEALILTRSTEAPDILDEGKFDVVFLDLHMPSPELARQMLSSRFNRTTPIVLISDDQLRVRFPRICGGCKLFLIQAN
jgi:DNA-binding response OmpR family regulator